jgi:hypothetical protein
MRCCGVPMAIAGCSPPSRNWARLSAPSPRRRRSSAGTCTWPEEEPWLPTFEAEVAAFPFSKFADQLDSMVHFLRALDSLNVTTRNLSAFRNWPKAPF